MSRAGFQFGTQPTATFRRFTARTPSSAVTYLNLLPWQGHCDCIRHYGSTWTYLLRIAQTAVDVSEVRKSSDGSGRPASRRQNLDRAMQSVRREFDAAARRRFAAASY